MRRIATIGWIGFLSVTAFATAALASEPMIPPAACPAGVVAPPKAMAAWSSPADLTAAKAEGELAGAALKIGQAVKAQLHPTRQVAYPVQPEKPGGSVATGGLFDLTVARRGVYRIAIGSAAWLDVLKDGKAMRSGAHGHGPDCTGIRKMVDFDLAPGRYIVQVSANPGPTMPILVLARP